MYFRNCFYKQESSFKCASQTTRTLCKTSPNMKLMLVLLTSLIRLNMAMARTIRVYQSQQGNNIFPETWSVPTTFSFWAKPLIVMVFGICLLCCCCAYRLCSERDQVVPVTPWKNRANHYMVRAKGRTDKKIYLRYENGLWIHATHSTT